MPRTVGRFLAFAVVGRSLLFGRGMLLGNGRDRLTRFRVGFGLRAVHELFLRVAPLATHPEHLLLGRGPFARLLLAIRLFELRHLGVGFGTLAGGPLRIVLPLARKRRQAYADRSLDFAALFLLGDDRRGLIVLG